MRYSVFAAMLMAAGLVALTMSGRALAAIGIEIDVRPSSAPNAYGSPSWPSYAANALTALQTGATTIGDRSTDPTAYLAFADGAVIDAGNAMVTSYPSWIGVADPAAPFDLEFGNRVHFGLHAFGNGFTEFTLADVNFDLSSTDGDSLGYAGDLSGTTFNGTTRIGVQWGADNAPGGGDDTIYNSGENDATFVDELFYVGVGNAFWPGGSDPDPGNPIAGRQGAIDETYAYVSLNSPLTFSGTYTIFGESGSASVDLAAVPESTAIIVWAGLVLCFGTVTWLKKKSAA